MDTSIPLNNCRLIFRVIFLPIFWVALQGFPQDSLALESQFQIEINKSSRELNVIKNGQIIKTYEIAYGKGRGLTKQILGDNNTPTGRYRVMLFKPDSKFHFFMQLDYPNLLDAWYGYKNNLISSKEFRLIATAIKNKEMPPQNTALGGYIGIHGLGQVNAEKLKIHKLHNWTEGCIAMKNEEINELRRFVSIGTPIIIQH